MLVCSIPMTDASLIFYRWLTSYIFVATSPGKNSIVAVNSEAIWGGTSTHQQSHWVPCYTAFCSSKVVWGVERRTRERSKSQQTCVRWTQRSPDPRNRKGEVKPQMGLPAAQVQPHGRVQGGLSSRAVEPSTKPTEQVLFTMILKTFRICFFHIEKPIITWMTSKLGRKQKQVITSNPNLSCVYFITGLTRPPGSSETGLRGTKHTTITTIEKIDNQQGPTVIAQGTILNNL